MIVKKLAVPFINEKLLQQVEHCYIATAAITDGGFDFIRSRIPTKTKMDIVTGLEMPSSPGVLQRIWRNYQGRISLHIYTRNRFHANLYIFDLPYRKSVAFIGSGNFTLDGIKDSEELFYKITDPKEIENLKSWFVGYYEFAQPLNETIISEYEWRYPLMKQQEHLAQLERKQFLLLSIGFSWDHIKFRQQFFKKEDYLTFGSNKAQLNTPEVLQERMNVQTKLVALHELIRNDLKRSGFVTDNDSTLIASSVDPAAYEDGQIRSMWLSYDVRITPAKAGDERASSSGVQLQITLAQMHFEICLVFGTPRNSKAEREHFSNMMNDADYRKQMHALVLALGAGYWIDVACERKNIESFTTEEALWEFTKADQWKYYGFTIGRQFAPDAIEISVDNIAAAIAKESAKLSTVYGHMRAPH